MNVLDTRTSLSQATAEPTFKPFVLSQARRAAVEG
jgi:hypothetical protein